MSFRFFIVLLTSAAAVLLQIAVVYLLPPPWNTINVLLVTLIILLITWESGAVVWAGFLAYWLLELYAATPFGYLLTAGTVALLAAYWLYQYLFTNRSWYAAATMAAAALLLYRGLLFGLQRIVSFFGGPSVPWPTMAIMWQQATELALSTLLAAIISIFLFWQPRQRSRLFFIR